MPESYALVSRLFHFSAASSISTLMAWVFLSLSIVASNKTTAQIRYQIIEEPMPALRIGSI